MKKGLFLLVAALAAYAAETPRHTPSAILEQTKGVAWCQSPTIAVNTHLACTGDIEGLATAYDLLHAHWKLESALHTDHGYILIFTK